MPYSQIVTTRKKRYHFQRSLRAAWRDTQALMREFRLPIIAFVIVTIGGGYVYGELYHFARGQVIAMIDRPYIMLQLMILETPEDVPPEWYLVIFWYLLPVIFAIIIGLGAADFFRLFFNRDERRDAWREAVVSMYRNHIIVFGAGHVGMRVIYSLVEIGVDTVVIDDSPDGGVEETLAAWGVPLLVGDGRQPHILEKAGLANAESFVVCTGNDHTNLEVIMKARDMNKDVRIVARMWDDRFAAQLQDFMNVQTVLSSSDLAAPAFAGAALGIEITQSLMVRGVAYSVLRVNVAAGSFLDGKDVRTLQKENEMDIVLHSRDHDAQVQPAGETIVEAGDVLVIFAQHSRILEIVSRNRRS